MPVQIAPVDLSQLIDDAAQLERNGTPYGYGAKYYGGRNPNTGQAYNPRAKAWLDKNPHKKFWEMPLNLIDHLDCSGYVVLSAARATKGKLILPDGSQMQREYFEKSGLHKVGAYADENRYLTDKRLFINFIRPGHNGCGPVGHVFWTLNVDADVTAETLESYGGHGVGSRVWNTNVLKRQWYNGFALPTVA